ncbi:NAD(P)/FAD-dependent oxidoreductase [Desulfotruncus alcoholivorax]|uniref:NAD(P)/FAD-dependent oxidoreductase n=1 Tax=Desulfotruncus alcoholivorax TaxID=265477 RepID=UPI000408A53F|nr:FAD-dependent oxidoreductase [Desulfotruncus alcoholivorax]
MSLNYVIVGNSAAGISAASTLRKIDSNARITVIDADRNGAYARCRIPEVLSGESVLADILYRNETFYQSQAIDIIYDRVIAINPGQRLAKTAGGRELPYHKLLLATGATPVKIGLDGAGAENVFALRNYADAVAMSHGAEASHRAVVLGGGLVGVKGALALRKKGMMRVTIAMKSGYLLSRQLTREAGLVLEEELTASGVTINRGVEPLHLRTLEGKINAIGFDSGKELPVDMVLVAKGVRPCTDLIGDCGGSVDRGILVNDYLQTSLPHIYAAGDCIEVNDAVTGRKGPAGLWPLAVEQGRFAALNMAGRTQKYPTPLTTMNAARFGNLPVVSVGPVNMAGDDVYTYGPKNKVYRRLVFNEGRLVSAIFTGVIDRAGVYNALIRSGRRVGSELRQRIIDGLVTAGDLIWRE